MQKVIFLDVDGTVVNYENQLPPSAVEAIRSARKSGHLVYLCTGRSKAEMPNQLWDIGIDGMIGGNGSYVEDAGDVVWHQTLSSAETRDVVDWLTRRGLEFYLEANEGLFASRNFVTAAAPVVRKYIAGKGQPVPDDLDTTAVFHGLVEGADLYRADINKVSFILNSYQDFLDAKAAFPDLKVGTWGGRDEEALFGDLGVKGINKSHAIQVLLEHLDVTQQGTVAFGDAAVDIPMLSYCAVAVAMGNASDEVKAVADFVTTDVDDDGLYKAFDHLELL